VVQSMPDYRNASRLKGQLGQVHRVDRAVRSPTPELEKMTTSAVDAIQRSIGLGSIQAWGFILIRYISHTVTIPNGKPSLIEFERRLFQRYNILHPPCKSTRI